MAYDPEARQNSNTAMIVSIVALVVVVVGGLAWWSSQSSQPIVETVPGPSRTTVIENTVTVPGPVVIATPSAPVVITQPGANSTTRIITNNNTTRYLPAPTSNAPSTGAGAPVNGLNNGMNSNAASAVNGVSGSADGGNSASP